MSLTNAEYNQIMREYEKKQAYDEREFIVRRDSVYQNYPALKEIDHKISNLGVFYTKKYISGDLHARDEMHAELDRLNSEKSKFLQENSLPDDILEKHYSCPDCEDTGFIGNKPCHCFIQAEIDLCFSQNRLSDWFTEHTFDNFCLDYYLKEPLEENSDISYYSMAKHALEKAKSFAANIIEGNKKELNNIVLFGATGTGKTFLTHCVAGELIRHEKSCIYITSPQLFDIMRDFSFNHENRNEFNSLFSSDLLIIDDLGAENTSNFVISGLFRILNERSLQKAPVMISTNLSLKELQSTYTERIISRLVGSSDFLQLAANDIRLQKKLEN